MSLYDIIHSKQINCKLLLWIFSAKKGGGPTDKTDTIPTTSRLSVLSVG